MKYYHKCVTGHGTELWVRAHTWFGAAMTAFGAQEATYIRSDKEKTRVEYSGGWISRHDIRERADGTVRVMSNEHDRDMRVIYVEVEGFAHDADGNIVMEDSLDPDTNLEQTYARVRYCVFLGFEGAGRDEVADFVDRDDAEAAREELITYFGLDAPEPPLEDT